MHSQIEDHNMQTTDDSETIVSSKETFNDSIKNKHLSHISADSIVTTESEFDDDDDDRRDHHRRSNSGSDSVYSVVTESTESPSNYKSSPPSTKEIEVPSPTSHTTTTSTIETPMLNIPEGEQLDPWSANPYDQDELAGTLHFKRSDSDEEDDVNIGNSITGLASANATTTTSLSSLAAGDRIGKVAADTLARLDHEFEMLTKGQAIQISTVTTATGEEFNREQLEDPRGIMERSISDRDKKLQLCKLFSRASSNGDMNRVADMLDNFRDWIDIEAHDEDGTTPLIYAACFGHTEIAFMLLEAGAKVDARDKFGWTALVWATNNKHENIVRLLLEQGASTSAQTAKGHTIVDFLRHDPNDNTKIVQIFQEPGRRDSVSSNGSLFRTNNSSLGDDLFYQSGIEGFEEIMAENERRYKMAMESANAFDVDMADLSLADQSVREEGKKGRRKEGMV
ncbi:hypothetical protein BGZ46_003456 [Entomortierella lignicola]|nr:hypothetical protein BGZ46_003456 [Entomortierella lignicola]